MTSVPTLGSLLLPIRSAFHENCWLQLSAKGSFKFYLQTAHAKHNRKKQSKYQKVTSLYTTHSLLFLALFLLLLLLLLDTLLCTSLFTQIKKQKFLNVNNLRNKALRQTRFLPRKSGFSWAVFWVSFSRFLCFVREHVKFEIFPWNSVEETWARNCGVALESKPIAYDFSFFHCWFATITIVVKICQIWPQ